MPRTKKTLTTEKYNRVLCFTTSYRRPYMLYNCIKNILSQKFTDFTYYVNINIDHPNEQGRYKLILDDFKDDKRLHVIYNQRQSQHQNYLKPIIAAGRDNFNIFVKIDDDDIYKSDYLSTVLNAYKKHKKDILSCVLNTTINGGSIDVGSFESIGIWKPDTESKVKFGMPCTYVMNQSAINILLKMTDAEIKAIHPFEDPAWRTKWREANLTSYVLKNCDSVIYNIHGQNVSSSFLYKDNIPNTKTDKTIYVENEYFILTMVEHHWWKSYVYLNKRNNRLYNIQNDDHGAYVMNDNTLQITWDNWGKEEFTKFDNNNITYFKIK